MNRIEKLQKLDKVDLIAMISAYEGTMKDLIQRLSPSGERYYTEGLCQMAVEEIDRVLRTWDDHALDKLLGITIFGDVLEDFREAVKKSIEDFAKTVAKLGKAFKKDDFPCGKSLDGLLLWICLYPDKVTKALEEAEN